MVNTQITATSGTSNAVQSRSVRKTAKTEDVAFDFGQMMNQSLNDMTQKKMPDFLKADSGNVTFGAESMAGAGKIKDVSQAGQPQKAEADKAADAADNKNVTASDKTETTDAADDKNVTASDKAETTDAADMDDVQKTDGICDALRQKIKDILGVTDEQIDEALAALQITLMDLLNDGNMSQFVVQVTGNESTLDLLTDSALSQGLFELENFAAQLSEEFDMPQQQTVTKEEMVVLEELPENMEKPLKPEEKTEEAFVVKDAGGEEVSAKSTESTETPTVTVTDSRSDAMKNETSADSGRQGQQENEHNANVVLNNLSAAVESVMEVAQAQGVDNYTAVSIVNQIVEAARVTLTDQVSTMELMLNPENLGRVALSVSLKEGVVTAQITAENQVAKEAIESQVVMLKEQLNNQGLKVEAVEVTIASHSFEAAYDQSSGEQAQADQRREKRSTTRQIDLNQLTEEGFEELSEEEQITAQMMANDGNMVNYRA